MNINVSPIFSGVSASPEYLYSCYKNSLSMARADREIAVLIPLAHVPNYLCAPGNDACFLLSGRATNIFLTENMCRGSHFLISAHVSPLGKTEENESNYFTSVNL